MEKSWVLLHAVVLFAIIVMALIMLTARPGGAAETPAAIVPADFLRFWQEADTGLAQWPLGLDYLPGTHTVQFTGVNGERCSAFVQIPRQGPPYTGAVLHLSASGTSVLTTPDDGLVHLFIAWDPAHPATDWQLTGKLDRRACGLYRGILNARQALAVLTALPSVPPGHAAVVGEGIGATEALALAALCPGDVACVVEYCPEGPNSRLAGLDPATRVRARYFDPTNFAGYVRAPVLLLGPESGSRAAASAACAEWVADRLNHVPARVRTPLTDDAANVQLAAAPPVGDSAS